MVIIGLLNLEVKQLKMNLSERELFDIIGHDFGSVEGININDETSAGAADGVMQSEGIGESSGNLQDDAN